MESRKVTLVELMIVLCIIALFSAMFSGSWTNMKAEARVKECVQQVEALQVSLQMYYANTGTFPENAGVAKDAKERGEEIFLADFLAALDFTAEAPVGGSWQFHTSGSKDDMNIYIDLRKVEVTPKQMEMMDALIDDGNLDTGDFVLQGGYYEFHIIKSSKYL